MVKHYDGSKSNRRYDSIFGDFETIRKIQAVSGLFLGSFLGIHLIGTVSALGGPSVYNTALAVFRKYYQHPLVELSLALSAIAHVLSGWYLWYKRTIPASSLAWTQRFNQMAGMYLSCAIIIHFGGARLPSLLMGDQYLADFSFNAHSLEGKNGLFFFPWYILLGTIGTYHSIYGTLKALANLNVVVPTVSFRISRAKSTALGTLAAVAFVVLGVVSFKDGLLYNDSRANWATLDGKMSALIAYALSFVGL